MDVLYFITKGEAEYYEQEQGSDETYKEHSVISNMLVDCSE